MHWLLLSILALGLVTAVVLVMLLEWVGHQMYQPRGIDMNDPEAILTFLDNLPLGAKLAVLGRRGVRRLLDGDANRRALSGSAWMGHRGRAAGQRRRHDGGDSAPRVVLGSGPRRYLRGKPGRHSTGGGSSAFVAPYRINISASIPATTLDWRSPGSTAAASTTRRCRPHGTDRPSGFAPLPPGNRPRR